MDIGNPRKVTRKEPTIIPIKITPPKKQPKEKPIYVPNWPTKRPADIPKEK